MIGFWNGKVALRGLGAELAMTDTNYHHTQRAPLCLLVYLLALTLLVLGWVLQDEPPIRWLFPSIGLLLIVIAASFHHLTVTGDDDRLSINFGPIPLFRRSVRYADITNIETGRTTILDGWGIHMSLRGGWVWNLWGRDCVVVRFLNSGVLWIGTDDAEKLAGFLATKISGPGREP
jgi:hypothetical protein